MESLIKICNKFTQMEISCYDKYLLTLIILGFFDIKWPRKEGGGGGGGGGKGGDKKKV